MPVFRFTVQVDIDAARHSEARSKLAQLLDDADIYDASGIKTRLEGEAPAPEDDDEVSRLGEDYWDKD